MIRKTKSIINFLIFVGFFWFLILVYFSRLESQRGSNDVKEVKIKLDEKLPLEQQPNFEDFEDDFANYGTKKSTKKPTKKEKFVKTLKKAQGMKIVANKIYYSPPKESQEVLDYRRQLNLTNPGHLGKPVNLSSLDLPQDIKDKIHNSFEIYSINEFLSRLIPLDRELPDIRPDYCRQVKYSSNLPVTSVIMIFHNEPFSMIMRSVFAVLNRTPDHLLGEIVLVDDCSTRGLDVNFIT